MSMTETEFKTEIAKLVPKQETHNLTESGEFRVKAGLQEYFGNLDELKRIKTELLAVRAEMDGYRLEVNHLNKVLSDTVRERDKAIAEKDQAVIDRVTVETQFAAFKASMDSLVKQMDEWWNASYHKPV